MAHGRISTALRQLHRLLGPRTSAEPEELLLPRYLATRDDDAFAALVQRYGPIVLGVCRRVLAEPSDIEDAFQATFLILLRKAASIAHPESLGAWLHGVAYRVSVRARFQAGRRRGQEKQLPAPPADDPAAAATWRELRPLLDEEIQRLPEKYRLPFFLCHIEGKTNEEAARYLGCPKGTVLSRLARARERLRKRLIQRGITLSGTALAAALMENANSATVPAPLVAATTSAARLYQTGSLAAPAALLAQGVMKTMLLARVKSWIVLLLILGVAGTSAGMLAHRVLAEHQNAAGKLAAEEEPPADKPEAAAKKEKPAPDQVADEQGPVPLAPGALARLGQLRFHHGEVIRCLAFSPDGKLLASAGENLARSKDMEDKSICLWDTHNGKELARLQGHDGTLYSLAFSPDGKLLASATQHQQDPKAMIQLWNIATGKEILHWDGHRSRVNALAFSPRGDHLASASADGTILVWKIEDR